jgi:drug/metabolite transporter (DMT)-like permease
MNLTDYASLIHPAIAVAFVFPIIGIVAHFAWQTRQRRLQSTGEGKSKIPPIVGKEHVKLGKWLTGSVVGVCLLGMAYPTFSKAIEEQAFTQKPGEMIFLTLMFAATIASLVFLYQAQSKLWRAIFALLSSLGVLVIGFQDLILRREGFGWIFRRDYEWQYSHFYYGIVVTILMIFSLAIVQEIYQDRSNRWRYVHIIANCLALLLFIGQSMTGTRDLLEVPLSWQKTHLYKCDFPNKTCP